MTQTHLLSDSITRIRNAHLVSKSTVLLLKSRLVNSVLDILLNEGYVDRKECITTDHGDRIIVYLKYKNKVPGINKLVIISKPGRRVYCSYKNLLSNYGGLGTVVLSTSRGLMTCHQAKKAKFGGEVLFKVF